MQSSLNRQISDLDKLTSDAQRSMDEMRRLLDRRGPDRHDPKWKRPKRRPQEKKPKAKGRGGAAAGPRAVVPRGEGSDGQNGHWAGRIFGQPVHRISPPERDGARKRQARSGRRDLRQRGHRQAQCACGFGCGALQRGRFEKRRGHEHRPFPLPERRRR